jgi:fumarate hydratase subunit alpha
MRNVALSELTETVRRLCLEANYRLPGDVERALAEARAVETSPVGREVLDVIIDNSRIARDEEVPLCQDTGFTVVWLAIGTEVHFDGDPVAAVHEGVRRGYAEGYLRKSIVADPFRRKNTGDNTPAVVHINLVPGDGVEVLVEPKGGGCENMSRIAMLKPADGVEGAREFVLRTIDEAGPNPCPPTIIGVGVGGTFELAALLAKHATVRPVGQYHPDPFYAELEKSWLEDVNKLGIGPQGLGGRTTALWLAVETHPCHIASLPVAVNVQCHSARSKAAEL